jgi:predicted dehydrogenase
MSPTLALIGAGPNAPHHLAACVRSPHVQAVALAEPNDDARRALVQRYGIIKRDTPDYRELLADPDLEVVDLCVPLAQRTALATEALQAGKHVLYEPPLAADLPAAQAALAAAQATGRRLLCAHSQLHYPAHLEAQKLLAAGEIGRPLLATMLLLSGGETGQLLPTAGETATGWLEPAATALGLLQFLLGPALAVSATLGHSSDETPEGDYDTALLSLELPEGVQGQITLCTVATGDRPTAERRLMGSQASLLIRDNPEDELPLVMLQGPAFQPLRVKCPLDVHEYALTRTVEGLLECLATDQPEMLSAAEDVCALATALAALESARTGCRVTVPPLPAPA